MPYSIRIVPDQRLVIATADGAVSLADIEAYLDRVYVAGQLSFAKLVDNRACDLDLTDEETELLAARIRAYHSHGETLGPVAMVVKPPDRFNARLFRTLAEADRPVRIFFDLAPARAWLEESRVPA
ncbi:MAG: hypothetical protein U1E23_02000 [Reyranellaceae bacterium]